MPDASPEFQSDHPTIDSLARWGTSRLKEADVPDAGKEAELLLARCLETDRGGIMVRRREQAAGKWVERYRCWVDRRASREPFQYITGEQEFLGHRFLVDSRVLVPRPETEGVVEAALALLPLQPAPGGAENPLQALDLGTGSGCIALSLALAREDLHVDGLDLSREALEAAGANRRLHRLEGRVDLHHGDMASLPESWTGRYHLVVSNPPYVPEEEWRELEPEVRDHEPRSALVAEGGGESAYQALAPEVYRVLIPGGDVVLELGHRSEPAAVAAVRGAGFGRIRVLPDFQGIPRVLTARRS